ncbi:MAG: DUF1292 domain-containing protein [Clostridia bacterium]|nr:DUF1292 domain-containing protein [Clostridia bacterium]
MTDELKKDFEELEEDIIVSLEFDDGEAEDCKLVCVLELEDRLYAAMQPVEGEDEFYFFNYKEIGEEEFELSDIETEEEFNDVAEAFFELMEQDEELQ